MRRECRELFSRQRQRKPLVSDPDMHHGTCVTHVPWCMSGSLNRGGGENVPDIPGAYATRNFTYLARGPCHMVRCPQESDSSYLHIFARGIYSEITTSLIARFMGPTWGPPGADRTQVGPMLAPWTLLSGLLRGCCVDDSSWTTFTTQIELCWLLWKRTRVKMKLKF